jgi:superfamily II DNA or RNA helicase
MPVKSPDDRETCDVAGAGLVQPLPRGVAPGTAIEVRGTRWMVHATVQHEDCRELHLSELQHERRIVLLWPFDRPCAIERQQRVTVVRPRKWWRRVAPLLAHSHDSLTPRARTATADVLSYQLAPAVAAAAGMDGLLLADEVGLGKTVQAGWIVADRLARSPDSRVLIAVPAGIRHQWASELSRHFGIDSNVVNAPWLRRTIAALPADVSPWAAPGVYVASVDFLKRPDLVRSLEQIDWDLLIVDEAHLATSPTDRFSAMQQISLGTRQIVLITATPYSGDSNGFTSMMSLACPGGVREPPMFRRSREDAGDTRRRRHRFALVRLTRDEQRLQRVLERYSRDVWRDAPGDREKARLAVTILRKRALSSPSAALRSLLRRDELLRGAAAAPRQLTLFEQDDEMDVEDELTDEVLAVPGFADMARERRTLTTLIEVARRAVRCDSKQRRLTSILRRLNAEAAIVFTEYRDTLTELAAALPGSLQLHGGLRPAERAAVQARFNEAGGVLLATDAASHGLNLQHRCRIVINYELPWNPARLEQRIGRVDRMGQRRPVHAVTLVARHTAEDLVLVNLTRRLIRVARSLGERDRLASFLTDARAAGIVIGDEALAVDEIVPEVSRASAAAYENLARVAAGSLQARRTFNEDLCPDECVFATAIRASTAVPPGLVLVVRCCAATADGEAAAERTVLLHVGGMHPSPTNAATLRRRCESILNMLRGDVSDAASRLVEGWFRAARGAHVAAADRRIQRERELLHREAHSTTLQPGLFDRRVLREADTAALTRRRLGEAHRDRLDALERSRELRLTCSVRAVLVAWR